MAEELENNEIEVGKVEDLKSKIDLMQAELEDREDKMKRLVAEFENFKKRSAKEREGLYNSLISDIFSSMLPVLDNLEKAAETITEDENYKKGIEMVLKQYKDVLNANGLKEIESVGTTFNPEIHEAISSVTDENCGVQEIKEEFRKGYIIGNKVVRHSLVVVAN